MNAGLRLLIEDVRYIDSKLDHPAYRFQRSILEAHRRETVHQAARQIAIMREQGATFDEQVQAFITQEGL